MLLTKAGPITVFSNPYRQVQACIVPHNVHIHQHKITLDDIIEAQPQCQFIPTMEMLKEKTFPIVSIVKGMTFGLVDLTDAPEGMAVLGADRSPVAKLDEEWNAGLAGCLYYRREGVEEKEGAPTIHKIHQRVMVSGSEDPGTGSASCALGCYLALSMANGQSDRKRRSPEQGDASQTTEEIEERTRSLSIGPKKEHFVFGIEQGVEMGRRCQICVEVDITQNEEGHRQVSVVMLSGRSTFMTKGEIIGVY